MKMHKISHLQWRNSTRINWVTSQKIFFVVILMRKSYIMQLISCNNRHLTSYLHWIKFFLRSQHFHIHYKGNLILFLPAAYYRLWQKLNNCPYFGPHKYRREAISFGNFVLPFSSKTNSTNIYPTKRRHSLFFNDTSIRNSNLAGQPLTQSKSLGHF
jgi:hypothetical protein